MTVRVSRLRSAALSSRAQSASSLNDAISRQKKTVFLCHSHDDRYLVLGVIELLRETGWDVYVDWADPTMPISPNRETALKIQSRIQICDWFLFLATSSSVRSRWCPWEIGYADGKKGPSKILIMPTSDGNQTHGNEYLQLYRRIIVADNGQLGAFEPGQTQGVLVNQL